METLALHKSYISWIFPAFLLIFGLIAFLRVFYPNHFFDYKKLLYNSKYIIIYQKKERKLHLFSVVLYLLQCLSLALFAYVCLKALRITALDHQRYLYLELVIIAFVVLTLKLLLQRWISSLFDLKEFTHGYTFTRLAYSNYAAILVAVLLFLGVYTPVFGKIFLGTLLCILLTINIISWAKIIKTNLKEIKPYSLYFILYFCTLEIAPYIFLIYSVRYLAESHTMLQFSL